VTAVLPQGIPLSLSLDTYSIWQFIEHLPTHTQVHKSASPGRFSVALPLEPVPTVTFNVLYVFFIIGHDRRRILHFNIARHPTSVWIVQQLREAFPYQSPVEFLILDHDSKYGNEVPAAIRSMDIRAIRTVVGCPWQNGVAERWVGSCRRELLDHMIALNESHLKRLLGSYIRYYHEDRTHCGLEKQTPGKRMRCSGPGKVVAWPRVGGLHHRYERVA
jgi:putative transposase